MDADRHLAFLPPLNAALNAVAAALLLRGRRLARARRVAAHRRTMIAAFAVSSAFLASYVIHKASRGFESTTFNAVGAPKAFYLALLASHVVLAMLVPVLAITLIVLGTRGRIASHRRLARVAWPIWMYVSVTGVAIYVMLYHLNPSPVLAAPPTAATVGNGLDPSGPKLLSTRAAERSIHTSTRASTGLAEHPIQDRGSPPSAVIEGARDGGARAWD